MWVKQGENFHENENRLWKRRNLSRFNLENGKILQNVSVASTEYNIHGIVDMVIETPTKVYPVEFKMSNAHNKRGGIYQLVAYGMIIGEALNKNCVSGFLAEGTNKITKIDFSEILIKEVTNIVKDIENMLQKGIKPDSSATIFQCASCEYRNHCNDRE